MDHLTAAGLGFVQGLTEFLPVSSSGHVAVAALLWGVGDLPLPAVVVLHLGTLLATLAVVGSDLRRMAESVLQARHQPMAWLRSSEGRLATAVSIASVPTAILGLSLEPTATAMAHDPRALGTAFVATALLLAVASRRGGTRESLGWRGALLVGLAQGLAVLPGISRSGSTIAVALLLGMRPEAAFRFSFLLSLPAITGALLLQLAHPEALTSLGAPLWTGGAMACAVGLIALLWLRRLVLGGRLWLFSPYLLALAAFLWFRSAP